MTKLVATIIGLLVLLTAIGCGSDPTATPVPGTWASSNEKSTVDEPVCVEVQPEFW